MADRKYRYKQRTWVDDSGKKHVVYGKTEQEAADKLAERKAQVKRGEYGISDKMTVNAWAEEWDRTYLKPRVRKAGADKKRGTMTQKSYEMYRQKLAGYILPEIGKMKIGKVKDVHLQKILNDEAECGMSESHIQKIRMVMNKMFARAVRSRVIVFNPADGLELPAAEKNLRRSLTAYEREVILDVAGRHRAGLWIKFLLGTGVRPGESAPLQVQDVDLKKEIVHIYKDIESGTANVVSTPKTAAGIRDIPLPSWLVSELKPYLKGREPLEYLFPQTDGRSMKTITCIENDWRSFLRQVDLAMGAETTAHGHIYDPKDLKGNGDPLYPDPEDPKKPRNGHKVAPDLVLYCLRHTYCTDLQRAGVPLEIARMLMGHEDITTTANIYTHSGEAEVIQARDLINKHRAKEA